MRQTGRRLACNVPPMPCFGVVSACRGRVGGGLQQPGDGLLLGGVKTASRSPSFAVFPLLGAAPESKVPRSSKAGFFQHHIAARCLCSSVSSLWPQGGFLVGKRGLCLELLTGSPGTVPWFWGTAPFILLFPEALDPGVERMCRAAGFEGNRLSAGRSFPSLCEPLGTFSLAQQRNRDLGLQERLFLQDLCSELASLQRQGCHERTAR